MEQASGPSEYITQEMKDHVPTLQDTFITIQTGDYQRLIWSEPMELREREEEAMEKFMEYIKENNLEPLPEFYTTYERHAFRFLQGCKWNPELAYNEIFQH
jgi:hypothetical protein